MRLKLRVATKSLPHQDKTKREGQMGWTNFVMKGGPVRLGFEWGASPYGGLTEKQLNITFSEEIGNYVEKINE